MGIRWYLIALLLPAAVILVSIGLNALTGGPAPDFSNESFPFGPPDTPLALKIGMLFLIFTLGFDGLGEELGWRGFALPRLKESQSALVASVILGVLWAVTRLRIGCKVIYRLVVRKKESQTIAPIY